MSAPAPVATAGQCSSCPSCQAADDTARYYAKVKEIRAELDDERRTPAKKPDSLPFVETLIKKHNDALLASQSSKNALDPLIHALAPELQALTVAYAAAGKPFSTTPLGQLKRIEIRSLSLRKRHAGRYLLVRVVSKLHKVAGISFIGQDPGGNAVIIGLFASPWALIAPGPELDAVLPLGSVLIIREPYMRVGEDGQPLVRVDSPTDVVFLIEDLDLGGLPWKDPVLRLPDQRPTLLTAEAYKTLGNAHLAKGWCLPADKAYSEGLRIEANHIALRLNRCQARLRQGLFRSSLADARSVLAMARTTLPAAQLEKALFRAGSAAYALQLWERSKTHFIELLTVFPSSKEAMDGLARISARVREARTGEYDWKVLFERSQKDPQLDIADYICHDLRIEDRKGRGRAVVANKAIKAGQLLMMVKPFASCYVDEVNDGRSLVLANLHTDTDIVEGTTQAHLTQKISRRLMEDSSLVDVFNLLYAGPTYPTPPSFSLSRLRPKEDASAPPVDIDTSRVEAVRSFNSFGLRRMGFALDPGLDDDHRDGMRTRSPAALYVLPSLINHACVPNAFWQFLGDAMYVRATTDVKEGDEITISYVSGAAHDARRLSLKKHGIVCGASCALCTDEAKDSDADRVERAALLRELRALQPPLASWDGPDGKGEKFHLDLYATAREIVEDIIATYEPTRKADLKYDMWAAYHYIGNMVSFFALIHPSATERARWATLTVYYLTSAIAACGCVRLVGHQDPLARATVPFEPSVVDHVIGSMLLSASTMKSVGNLTSCKKYINTAYSSIDRLTTGGSKELFKHRWSRIAKDYDIVKELNAL